MNRRGQSGVSDIANDDKPLPSISFFLLFPSSSCIAHILQRARKKICPTLKAMSRSPANYASNRAKKGKALLSYNPDL